MGYFKNTTYYGPNCQDFGDNSPEALAERRPHKRPGIATNFDSPICVVCLNIAPTGYLWADGICTDCRELTEAAR